MNADARRSEASPDPALHSAPIRVHQRPSAVASVASLVSSRGMLLVFLLALAVRLLYLIDSADLPTFHQPIVDAETYDAMARSALANGRFSDPFFWQPFFYPAFLVFIYAGTGGSLLAAKLAQLLVGSLTCVLIARLARRLQLSPRATLAAGLIGALY